MEAGNIWNREYIYIYGETQFSNVVDVPDVFGFVVTVLGSGSMPIGSASKFLTFCRYRCLESSYGSPV